MNFDGKSKVSNSFTKLFSLVIIFATVSIGVFLSSDFIQRSNSQISQYEQFESEKVNNYNIKKRFIAIKINENGEFNDDFKILMGFVYSDLNNKLKKKYFEFEKCTVKHIDIYKNELKFYEKLKIINLNKYLCLPIKLTNQDGDIIPIKSVNKKSISIFPLKKKDLQQTKNFKLITYYDDYEIKILNKNIECKRLLLKNTINFYLDNSTIYKLYFNENIIKEDIGIFTEFYKKNNYFIFSNLAISISKLNNKNNSLFNNKYGFPSFSYVFLVNSNEKFNIIKYMKFQEFFAQIFSIFNLLYYICLFFCNLTIKIKIKLVLINKLFDTNDYQTTFENDRNFL